jgi:membrane-associated phospholipid phosphatase
LSHGLSRYGAGDGVRGLRFGVPSTQGVRSVGSWTAFSWSASGLVLLALSVGLQLLNGPDRWVRDAARPERVWGPVQIRSSYVVEGLRPVVVAALLATVAVAVCLSRRTVRPAVLAVATCAVAAGATLLTKLALARPDPYDHATDDHGGSFPSGHTISVLVCLGLAVCLLRPGARWWGWLAPGAAAAVMGTALVIEGAHRASDVAGGLLLGVAVLSAARATGFIAWSARSPQPDPAR